MKNINTAAMRARCEAATPEPWIDNGNEIVTLSDLRYGIAGAIKEEDNAFIAEARTDLPALLDAYEALEAENAQMRDKGNCGKCRFNGSSRPCSTCIWSGLNGSDYFEPLPAAPDKEDADAQH
jgi:hypothetical protein